MVVAQGLRISYAPLLECDKQMVAAITGAAVGFGATILPHCDFVYVSDEARLVMPVVSLGLVPEFASSPLSPQLMGFAGATEKLLLIEPLSPEQAEWSTNGPTP